MGTYEIPKNVGVCNKSEDENNLIPNFPRYSYIDLPFLKRDNPYKNEFQFLKRGNNSNIKLSILYLCLNNCHNMQRDKTVYFRKMHILLFFGYQTNQFLLPSFSLQSRMGNK